MCYKGVEMSEKKPRRRFPRELKRKLVNEYLSGESAQTIGEREGIPAQFLYRWKTQIEEDAKKERIGELEASGMSYEEAQRFRDMEEELAAYKEKVAEQALHIDLLKKLQPNYQSEKKSNGYSEIKRKLARSKRRSK